MCLFGRYQAAAFCLVEVEKIFWCGRSVPFCFVEEKASTCASTRLVAMFFKTHMRQGGMRAND